MDHTQLNPVDGRPFLLSSLIITCFTMVKLETPVRCAGDENFIRLQEILRMHHSMYTEDLLNELGALLSSIPIFVDNWDSEVIGMDTYRLYGKKAPAIEATRNFINSIKNTMSNDDYREKRAVDLEKIRHSHRDWLTAQPTTSKILSKKVKEPENLLFFRFAIYEFTHNLEDKYSHCQMAILYDLPSVETLQANRNVEVLAAPPGLRDLDVDATLSKDDFISKGYYKVKVGIAPIRTQKISNYVLATRKQYALKHRVTSTIHASMGDTLKKISIQIAGGNYDLWDKAQIIVALTRTKRGRDIFFVGNKVETINSIVSLVQTCNQWSDYMESVLDLVTVVPEFDSNDCTEIPAISLSTQTFPFRICEIALPQCQTGFVYFLISVKTLTFTYIGECKCSITRLKKHNSGFGSSSSTPANKRPYAVFGYIAGFDNSNKSLRRLIERKWKENRDFLIGEVLEDPRRWFHSGRNVIEELNRKSYNNEISELQLVELFR